MSHDINISPPSPCLTPSMYAKVEKSHTENFSPTMGGLGTFSSRGSVYTPLPGISRNSPSRRSPRRTPKAQDPLTLIEKEELGLPLRNKSVLSSSSRHNNSSRLEGFPPYAQSPKAKPLSDLPPEMIKSRIISSAANRPTGVKSAGGKSNGSVGFAVRKEVDENDQEASSSYVNQLRRQNKSSSGLVCHTKYI